MLRIAFASLIGFILIYIESSIVIQLKGYETIDFGGIAPFVSVWAMNFFLVFAILTQVKTWYDGKYFTEEVEEENIY